VAKRSRHETQGYIVEANLVAGPLRLEDDVKPLSVMTARVGCLRVLVILGRYPDVRRTAAERIAQMKLPPRTKKSSAGCIKKTEMSNRLTQPVTVDRISHLVASVIFKTKKTWRS
jgi:hypothetical protein